MKTHQICLLPGDGIGPEVIAEAARLLSALPMQVQFEYGEIGYGAYQKTGSPLPETTLEIIRRSDATLFGAVTTPPNIAGYFSPIIRLRKTFDLFANLRPCRSFPHPSCRPDIDMLIVRENTEDLYMGVEHTEDDGNTAVSEMIITRRGSERIIRKAFDLARQNGYQKVTVVHKANVLRETCGLFRKVAFEIAPLYPDIQMEEMLVDTCAMELVRAPEQFQVIVTTNLFGDILSDEASMLVGGLGVACSGNIGASAAIFEPVHGSAPKLAGTAKANPIATFLSTAMMLEYLGEGALAQAVRTGVLHLFETNQVTEDLGGSLTTQQVTDTLLRGLA